MTNKKSKLYEITTDVPMPPGVGSGRGRWIKLVDSMTVGSSTLLKNRDEYASFHKAATSRGYTVVSCSEDGNVRVWLKSKFAPNKKELTTDKKDKKENDRKGQKRE